jgi:polyhydroxybutyrate depolymerase
MKNLFISFLVFMSISVFAIDQTGSITSGSISRSFIFHANATTLTNIPQNLPLMIVMHGDGGNGANVKSYTNFDNAANANNYIVVYPDAINTSWNRYADNVPGDAGLGNANAPDDVAFISDLIDYFCSTYKINRNKIYATGHSAGGYMAYNLALQLPNKIAAFAPVAASLWGESNFLNQKFANYTPVPICHIHGDLDNTVSYPDPNNTPDSWNEWPLNGFSNGNCSNSTYITTSVIVPDVNKLIFCGSNKKVELIKMVGGGHGWPSAANFDAATYISQFCLNYSLTSQPTCQALANDDFEFKKNIQIFPNPIDNILNIKTTSIIQNIQIFDLKGRLLLDRNTNSEEISLNIDFLETGIYSIKISDQNNSLSYKIIKN